MRSFKRNAVSRDSPDYLIRNKNILLQTGGNCFFMSAERARHPLPQLRTFKTIRKESKFGMSRDSPFLSLHSYIRAASSSIFDDPYLTLHPGDRTRLQPNIHLKECLKRAKTDTSKFNHMMRMDTPMQQSPKKTFSLLMDSSAPYDQKVMESFLNPYNLYKLNASISGAGFDRMEPRTDLPYRRKLIEYTTQLSRSTLSKDGTRRKMHSTSYADLS